MFFNKIDVLYCLVVFFVVCPRLRPFWSVFGELALFWCSTAKRKKRGKYILWLRKRQENLLDQWLIHILKTVHLQQLKRMPRFELGMRKGYHLSMKTYTKRTPFSVIWLSWYCWQVQSKKWRNTKIEPALNNTHTTKQPPTPPLSQH